MSDQQTSSQRKIAFVTGGTGGIGSHISRQLCQDGYHVIAGYFNQGDHSKALKWQADLNAEGVSIDILYGDVSNPESTEQMAKALKERFGVVSVLVNCAGITRDSRIQKMMPDAWQSVIDTNLSSVFNVSRLLVTDMLQQKYGRIISISSINGQKGQFGQVNYSAAKAGLYGFTKALAQEVAAHGVTVNTISPGYIETDMLAKVPEKIRQSILDQIPVGRFGRPEEISRIVSFLASEDSGFITGSDIAANGGHYM